MWAVSIARFVQYAGATGLFGAALFYLTLLPPKGNASASALRWPKPLLVGSSLLLFLGALLSLAAQAATMNGITLDKLDIPSVSVVLTDTHWGHAIAARIALSFVTFLTVIIIKPSRCLWQVTCLLGVVLLASFAWTGHGASTEGAGGWVHLIADIAHMIAAGVWLGALAAFLALLCLPKAQDLEQQTALFDALKNFSGMGSALVAVLVVSGLINSYFLIGVSHIGQIFQSTYGILLTIKVIIFAGMLILAGLNRFRLTPALEISLAANDTTGAIKALRRSLILETLAGLAVLALVAAFGMMEPPSAL
ncbi:copper homeostasis membrane protein CopD [Asticcacaulis sp. EMRT-3]|uniref:copper homeostasis membrane protein CopD n=1 Tax=Asticcacaulis sp. EMRT-3 TaxID=3040349 RepID=UPI0024AFE9F1|nr:copper homeostasis membrane protein CopD [Asticcacaulis sp. EMRT-3]MDI7776551.1 copper homeostasis membrane protein CopD [Asticcacaulis sp. EMRT-3]